MTWYKLGPRKVVPNDQPRSGPIRLFRGSSLRLMCRTKFFSRVDFAWTFDIYSSLGMLGTSTGGARVDKLLFSVLALCLVLQRLTGIYRLTHIMPPQVTKFHPTTTVLNTAFPHFLSSHLLLPPLSISQPPSSLDRLYLKIA